MFSSLACVLFFAPHIFHAPDLQSTVGIYPSTKNFLPPPYCQSCPVLPTFSVGMVTVSKISCPSLHFSLLTPIGYKVMNNADVLQYVCIYLFFVLFQMPKMQFRSNAKPSLYAYPEPLKPPKKEEKEKV